MANKYDNDNLVVYGIFKLRSQLEECIDALQDAGYRHSDISILASHGDQFKEFSREKATKAPEGATAGASSGMLIGGTLGLLAGIGSLAIPGVGPLIAAGPIMATLAGAGVGGAVGTLAGALIGMGMPEYEAKRYAGLVSGGATLLSVHCDDAEWRDRAKEILEAHGAHDISSSSEAAADNMAANA